MQRKAFIAGVGVDIVEIGEIKKARFKTRIAEYFLTKKEQRQMPKGSKFPQFLASRLALKEAVIKAFPEYLSPFDFRIEKKGKRPIVVFVSKERNKKYSVFASLTHTPQIAAAIAVVHIKK